MKPQDGYILFLDWDSKKKQRHYNQKRSKLLLIHEAIEKKYQPNLDYKTLETEWHSIIQSINIGNYTSKRNPIKHIHAEKHDVKIQMVDLPLKK